MLHIFGLIVLTFAVGLFALEPRHEDRIVSELKNWREVAGTI
jgi:hypothetical protein